MKQTKSTKSKPQPVVAIRLHPMERLAVEQAAARSNTNINRFGRAALLRAIKETGK